MPRTFIIVFAGALACFAYSAEVKRPPIVGVAHIALKAKDLMASRQYYGHDLGYEEIVPPLGPDVACFKVNDHQYIEVSGDLKSETEDRLSNIAFETTDVRRLRDYLASRGVTVPPVVSRTAPEGLSFTIKDPNGHDVEFVQYVPAPGPGANAGKFLPASRISERIIHVGLTVTDRAAADHLYKDILEFRETWHGGRTDDVTDWVDMRVPEGTDWLEYMLNVHNPSPKTLGVMHHLALGVPSVDAGYKTLLQRDMKIAQGPKIGRDGKWQLNLYDPDLTRAELMEPKPVQTPCCSPMLDK